MTTHTEKIESYINSKNNEGIVGSIESISAEFNSLIGKETKETKTKLNLFEWLKNDKNLLEYAELLLKEELKRGEKWKMEMLELKLSITCSYFKDFKEFVLELKKGENVNYPFPILENPTETVTDQDNFSNSQMETVEHDNNIKDQLPHIQNTINIAESQIGKPYIRGGTSESGFDCSGLWNWVFKKQGIDFNHRFTAALFSKTDVNIPTPKVRVGDFMYWDEKPGSKKHSPIYHIEMVVGAPFYKDGKWYVKTLGSSSDKSILNANGKKTSKSGVGYRMREISSYRHFGRPPYYLQMADYQKNHNQTELIASTTKVSPDVEQRLVA